MTYLLTWQGTLLAQDRGTGALTQLAVQAPDSGAVAPVRIDLPWGTLRGGFHSFLHPAPDAAQIALKSGGLAGLTAILASDRRTLNLSQAGAQAGRYVCAEPDGRSVTQDRGVARGWETFLPLTEADLAAIRHLASHAWILRSTRQIVPPAQFAQGFALQFGAIKLDLRQHLPFDPAELPLRITLLREGWKIEQACLFRPLVYYSAFGDPVLFEQLALSIRSLIILGRYAGDVHVLTDRDPLAIARDTAPLDPSRLTVQRIDAADRVARTAAKFAILDWPAADQYQPLLFVDADTIFNADIGRMLVSIALSDRIGAPAESFSPLRTAPSAGAALFAQDAVDPGDGFGFNSGTLGIANLAAHGPALRLVRQIIVNRGLALGRQHFSWVDQPVMNYALHKLGGIETAAMTGFVRHGYAGIETDPGRRTGLVHFWPPRDQRRKRDAMRRYLQTLGVDPSPPSLSLPSP